MTKKLDYVLVSTLLLLACITTADADVELTSSRF